MNPNMTKVAIALGICYAAYKFGPAPLKAAALGVAGVVVAKQTPVLKDYV